MNLNGNNYAAQKRSTRKVKKKLRRLQKAKKLKRYMIDAIKDVRLRKHANARKRAVDIKDDWYTDRQIVAENEADDDILPLDMLDADIDWENSAFASKIRRIEKVKNDAEIDDIESKTRRFPGTLDDNMRELLPIKVGTKVIRQTCKKDESNESEDKDNQEEDEISRIDLSQLSAAELLKLCHSHVEEAKGRISSLAYLIIADPHAEVHKLKELYLLSIGKNIFSLARETVIKLASISLAEVFVDIIPGYVIRPHTEDEMAQKLKKETKKLYDFEQTLLRYYLKYLQHLESYAAKLLKASKQLNSLPIVCLKCLSRVLLSAPHFNYASNIISFIVRITSSNFNNVIDICCSTLSELFHNDLNFRISATAAKYITSIVNQKKGNVPPALIATFLNLKIKEVNKGGKSQKKEKLLSKKRLLNKEKKSKSKERFARQLKKLEADLKEAEAAESISTKLSFATETMNHVFATYFRIIKRLPTTSLLEPVLEGLAKFAHLINVEFFDDMISSLSLLINQQHLRLVDSLRCIYTSFVMLSGEGVALNIDPSRFYWSMYHLLPALAFEKQDALVNTLSLTLRTLDLMINCRRKQVPVCRVAAYIKRLLALAFFMPSSGIVSILLCIRSFFIAYPKLDCMLENTDGSSYIELFKPELDDPDCCGGLSSSIIAEISIFSKHSDKRIGMIALYLQSGLPSTGPNRLLPEYSVKKAYEWYEENKHTGEIGEEPFFKRHIIAFSKKHKLQLTSKTLHQLVCRWVEQDIESKS
ncbi:Nucleolar complex-associated family protein [Acanthocheilonema viteae]